MCEVIRASRWIRDAVVYGDTGEAIAQALARAGLRQRAPAGKRPRFCLRWSNWRLRWREPGGNVLLSPGMREF